MNKMKRLIALLLCAAMLLSFAGCETEPPATEPTQTDPPPTEPEPTEPEPTEPPAEDVYAAAREGIDSADAVTLDISVVTTTTLADQIFTEASDLTLTYANIGTETLQVWMEEEIRYNIHEEEKEEKDEDEDDETITYSEIYSDGTVYAELMEDYAYCGNLTAEECAGRYLPAVLLDASLYETLTAETTDTGTTITFSAPTGAESWAMPEGAEMLEASGSAQISADGVLEQMNYTITYQYGPAEIKLEVESKPQETAAEIVVPEDPERYHALQYVDALRQSMQTAGILVQAESVSTYTLESVYCQAAGVVRNQSVGMDLHGEDEDLATKIETGIYLMDYSTYQSQEMDQEETYIDGKYTVVVDDGVPTSQVGISYEDVQEYCYQLMIANIVDMSFWDDVTATDLGSVYLVEYTFNEDFGAAIQNGICQMFWEDPAFLNNLASAYVTNEVTGYMAVDKFTGLPTSAGYYYEGTHTIDGIDYTLTCQSDQSIEAPALGAYYAITEKMLPEEEPENKATPLFYHVTGENGQEMWLLGTIHIGDERTAYLPQEIYDALAASDALALEYDSDAFEEQMEEDEALQDSVSNAYYYSGGSTLVDHIGQELYDQALPYMKAAGGYNMNSDYMKPYLWSNTIDNFYRRQGYNLTSDQGVESRLEEFAHEHEIEIRSVESGLFQIQMTTGWSDELQKLLLEESLATDPQELWAATMDLYEKWCAGDEAVLREELSDAVDTSEFTEEELAEYEAQLPLMEEYNKSMSYDRNDGMLEVAIEYLESGETVFYAVGLAHLLNDVNGLVDTLRAAGYTVELVEYAD